ncbi:MAG TPA: hypothetical protein VF091_01420 [Gaiellaceae bacterium]
MRRLLFLTVVAVACGIAAPPAGATNECKGLQVCVPITGPWVLATPGQVEFQMSCPKRFIVGGLDAELSSRGLDVGFVGSLGSPVNPGITTSQQVVFLGRLVRGRDPAPFFRPHIGCVPASGGGQRVPTAFHPIPPGKPTVREVRQVVARPGGIRHVAARCAKHASLVAATHAIGFPGDTPPTVAAARSVHVTQHVVAGRVALTIRAGAGVVAIVQLDLLCGAAEA